MSTKQFRYSNVILSASHQWCGNIEEYFAKNTALLLVFIFMPRFQNKDHVLRVYRKGVLAAEIPLRMSKNIFLYYARWYWHYMRALFTYFPKKEKVWILTHHPYIFPGMSLVKLLRKVEYVFWIGDYFPPVNTALWLYEKFKKFYHNRIPYAVYLSDTINKQMNGKILHSSKRKTVMWGVKPKLITRSLAKTKRTLLYVGVIRPSVGLELAFEFLKQNPAYSLMIIGVCDTALYKKMKQLIRTMGIAARVYFPNKFFFDRDLNTLSKKVFAGIALYTLGPDNGIYYTDPGKVKAYTEMGLPLIMSNTSSVASYVQKYQAGEVIERTPVSLGKAVAKIQKHYPRYLRGVRAFNAFFHYESYYQKAFRFLESV